VDKFPPAAKTAARAAATPASRAAETTTVPGVETAPEVDAALGAGADELCAAVTWGVAGWTGCPAMDVKTPNDEATITATTSRAPKVVNAERVIKSFTSTFYIKLSRRGGLVWSPTIRPVARWANFAPREV
jgi:hypothetical protein